MTVASLISICVALDLDKLGFGVTFFITNTGGVVAGREGNYLSWGEICRLTNDVSRLPITVESIPTSPLFRTMRRYRRDGDGIDMKVQVPCNTVSDNKISKSGIAFPTVGESVETVCERERYVDGTTGLKNTIDSDIALPSRQAGADIAFDRSFLINTVASDWSAP